MFDIVASIAIGTAITLFTIALVWIIISDYIQFRKEMR
jgi:hypothetical protein